MSLFAAAVLVLVQSTPGPVPLVPPTRLVDQAFAGAPHVFTLKLRRGEALIGQVEQKGVDLIVRLRDGAGKVVFEVDSPNGADGPEPIAWIASADGDYHLEVHPFESASTGAYDLTVEAPRPATTRDRELTDALAKYLTALRDRAEALRLQGEGQFAPSHALYLSAKKAALRALDTRRRQLGAHATALAPVHELLGLIDDEIGEYRSGVEHFSAALAILERAHGTDHPSTITTRSDLGHLKLAAGDHAGAAAIFESVLALREREGDQARTANALVALGDTLARAAQLDRAEAALRRAAGIRQSSAGVDHPSTRIALIMLGAVLVERGGMEEGEAICARIATAMRGATGGSFHRAAAERCLAKAAARRRDFAAATTHAESMARILEAAYGPDAPPTAEGLALLGSIRVDAGDVPRGREILQRALGIQQRRLGGGHPSTLKTRALLDRRPSASK